MSRPLENGSWFLSWLQAISTAYGAWLRFVMAALVVASWKTRDPELALNIVLAGILTTSAAGVGALIFLIVGLSMSREK